MKINEVIDIVSATQDNDALINRGNPDFRRLDDHLSNFIEKSIDRCNDTTANIDLEQLESDLSYALIEIKKAKDAVTTMKERIDY